MTINEIKDAIEEISLDQNPIKDFDYGEDFLLATGKGNEYPLVFLELPLTVDYELTGKQLKNIKFALLILDQPSTYDVQQDLKTISDCEELGDRITKKLQSVNGLNLESVNGLSLREFSDDNVSGMRYEISASTFRKC